MNKGWSGGKEGFREWVSIVFMCWGGGTVAFAEKSKKTNFFLLHDFSWG